MFKKINNIETAFQHIRVFTIMLILATASSSVLIAWFSLRAIHEGQDKIFVLSSGKVLEAFSRDRMENIPVEARDHIKTFHELFFTLAPDEKVITNNITRALYLADGSAKRLNDNLKESGYYSGIISGNISQDVSIDSISLNMDSYPFYFLCYAKQRIIRPTSLVIRNLETEGYLRTISRSDNDPHGFLIERWNVLNNKDLKTERR